MPRIIGHSDTFLLLLLLFSLSISWLAAFPLSRPVCTQATSWSARFIRIVPSPPLSFSNCISSARRLSGFSSINPPLTTSTHPFVFSIHASERWHETTAAASVSPRVGKLPRTNACTTIRLLTFVSSTVRGYLRGPLGGGRDALIAPSRFLFLSFLLSRMIAFLILILLLLSRIYIFLDIRRIITYSCETLFINLSYPMYEFKMSNGWIGSSMIIRRKWSRKKYTLSLSSTLFPWYHSFSSSLLPRAQCDR